ncbi:hypothetical protein R6V09_52695 [Streptomyces sp. W16]|uniref:hypothetical protein n=1 Tax=Streptomyces sp. W16 TaxID=3076631 RepID=UPI00295B5E3C|nr:hypothetical protein [Streptomyces sp. W16]MDV9178769.1 hypothetical protein [Streptomyces sp. W16]
MAEASSGGQPGPAGDEPTPAGGSDGVAPADPAATAPAWTEIGRGVGALLTVVAALGGLILGIRAEQRADEAERRAPELDRKASAEQVDFYRTPSEVVVMNGNPHPVRMRLFLPDRHLWWDLYALAPCRQIKIPDAALRDSMRARFPSARFTDGELASLWLEFTDPVGKTWVRSSGGALASPARSPTTGPVGRLVLGESWNRTSQDSPVCGTS